MVLCKSPAGLVLPKLGHFTGSLALAPVMAKAIIFSNFGANMELTQIFCPLFPWEPNPRKGNIQSSISKAQVQFCCKTMLCTFFPQICSVSIAYFDNKHRVKFHF
uniref:Uncharacterized protein n=1 Tax=Pyxicephalus adspersus TaxID=30357 RepID=A0AAV3APM7_PYXAD|nr:TPA: hypothetical protein GDO54_011393 [Pyxicephalus adspersus]